MPSRHALGSNRGRTERRAAADANVSAAPAVVVVCALPSEAAPLAERWRLRQVSEAPFPFYRRGQRALLVSGVGAHASAAAVGYAAALHARRDHVVWCNAGIAGHGDFDVGTAIAAHSVEMAGGTLRWHPFVAPSTSCRALPCFTYDAAVTDYPDAACCDMEAAGFLAALARAGTTDVATVFKVVSDNRASGLAGIVRTRVDALMASRVAELEAAIDAACVAALQRPVIATPLVAVLERVRYTRTQQRQIHELALRLHAFAPATWYRALPKAAENADAVLAALQTALQSCSAHPPPMVPAPPR